MRRTQRGLAAVTALLIVAVAASAAALMLAQQSAMLDQTAMVASRAQADAYAQAGFDWARGVLAEDARSAGDVDSLREGWAQPIAALPVERAVVSGLVEDEQGKFNLNNLVQGGSGSASAPDVQNFKNLLGELGLPPGLAEAALDWIDAGDALSGNDGAEDAYYLSLPRPYRAANQPMLQVEELYRVRGFDAKVVARLRPHVTALPARTAVNVNTAGEPVLRALLAGVPADRVRAMLETRATKPLRTKDEIVQATGANASDVSRDFDVKSAFFQVRVQVAQDDVHLAADALVERKPDGRTTLRWRRPRF